MPEKKTSALYLRTHQDILNEYWDDIEHTFASLEAITPNKDDLNDSSQWRYCQTANKKDRKKIGYLCQFGWLHQRAFIKITVNHFKLGKVTFNSLTLDKTKKDATQLKTTLPKAVIDALKKEQQEKRKQQDAIEEQKRETLFKEKWALWQKASQDISSHPYAIKKQLISNNLLRQCHNELIYPLTHTETGKICGIQIINEKGEKRIYGKQKNTYVVLGDLAKATTVYLCEGYATANAVMHLADSQVSFAVINTLNCHNLIATALWVKNQYTGKKIVIAVTTNCKLIPFTN